MLTDIASPVLVQRPPSGRAHAIVIGSGFGGLAAAVRLGARGYRVTVLDEDFAIPRLAAAVVLAGDAAGVVARARRAPHRSDRHRRLDRRVGLVAKHLEVLVRIVEDRLRPALDVERGVGTRRA